MARRRGAAPAAAAETGTILTRLRQGQSHFQAGGQPLSSQQGVDGRALLVVGADHGNAAYKGAVLSPQGRLHTVHLPCAYEPARDIVSGEGAVTYEVNGGVPFWIGGEALARGGEALRVGRTEERLIDLRQIEFLAAALVETLRAGGYAPGHYDLALGLAIPNNEIQRLGTRLGVDERTGAALRRTLLRQTLAVTRQDGRGGRQHWRLTIAALVPQAQTLGTFVAWSHTPDGTLATDRLVVSFVDIGGGDLQISDVTLQLEAGAPRYSMTSRRAGDGTVRLARALQQRYPQLSEIAAHQALWQRRVLQDGQLRDIGAELAPLLATEGEALLARLLPVLRQRDRAVVISGGGALVLREAIRAQIAAVGRSEGAGVELVDPAWAPLTNAVGVLFSTLFTAQALRPARA